MLDRRIPEWLRHAPTPGVRGFAVLSGCEATARGILISVMPITVYAELGDARVVSEVYFLIGLLSLATGLLVPWLTRFVPRRFIYAAGCLAFITGTVSAAAGGAAVIAGLALITLATVTIFVCTNAYLLDYIARTKLGHCESSRLFYAAFGWTVGPALGVSLQRVWGPAPFVISGLAIAVMLAVFLRLRMGNGRLIVRAARPSPNPLGFIGRFAAQPRLVTGWLFAVIRSCGWWVYVVYLPIFAIQSGLGDQLGGWLLSFSNGCLFLAPTMMRWMQRNSVRRTVRAGFLIGGLLFCAATLLAGSPLLAICALVMASGFLILLDVSAGLPFLLAVKPSERTEMSAIYASFRDVSGIMTPGVAWMVLLVAPVSGLFMVCGAGLMGCGWLARLLHPRLGSTRISVEPAPAPGLAGVPRSEPA